MMDTVNGKIRARAWPRKRGKPKNPKTAEQVDWFRMAQLATKYISPQQYVDAVQATEGTPLLPRDIMTMMMASRCLVFIAPDGTKRFPMAARIDVETALDTITQTPGDVIQKTEDGWQGRPLVSPAGWVTILDQTVVGTVNNIVVPGIDNYAELILWDFQLKPASTTRSRYQVSINGGASYLTTNGNYALINANGTLTNSADFSWTSVTSINGLMGVTYLRNRQGNMPPFVQALNVNVIGYIPAATAPITHIKVSMANGAAITGGRLLVMGR